MKIPAKAFFIFLILIFSATVFYAFLKFFVLRDYLVYAHASCDPATEICFVAVCDPEYEECAGDPEEDTYYYSLITKNAQNIAVCDPSREECPELTCTPGEAECEITYCTEELATEEGTDILCSDPGDFLEEASEEENAGETIDDSEIAAPETEETGETDLQPGERAGDNPTPEH